MSASLKAKLYADAKNFLPLALLLTPPAGMFQWFDQQLAQNSNHSYGSVAVQQISNPQDYAVSGRLPTSFSRMQFTVYGVGNDSENADQIVEALTNFLDQWARGSGIDGLSQYSNRVVGDRDMGIAETNPLTYMRIVDVMILNNSNV